MQRPLENISLPFSLPAQHQVSFPVATSWNGVKGPGVNLSLV